MNGHHARLASVLLVLGLLASCARIRMDTPQGFAPLDPKGAWRALSPEGVRVEAHWVKNDLDMTLDFWVETLEHQLSRQGYAPLGEPATFLAGERTGALLEWSLPLGDETWTYLTGIVVAGKRVLLIQAAGEQTLYTRYRASILSSLSTLRF